MKQTWKLFIFILLYILFVSSISQAKETFITLKKGETLYKIAKKHGIPVDILIKYNNITDTTKVKEGTKIRIPVVYTVKKGDTLYSIAKKYEVTVNAIIEYNSISDSKKIKIGLKLIIPASDIEAIPSEPEKETNLLWPHSGKRKTLNGKLKGLVILGNSGDTIISVSTGKVIWAEAYRGYGKMVLIKSKDGYIYIYAGNEKLFVELGEDIRISTPIGLLGKNPHDGIPQVYFCVYKNGKPVDPYKAPRM